MHPTIFALSSGQGRAGVAVIRISGPAAGSVLDRMAAPRPGPRYAGLRRIRHPVSGEVLDEALVLWLPAPRSETGEDMAELQVHGGRAVVRAVLDALGALDGCRLAEPGEFARRAFEGGRMDLTAVEGLADLIEAETEAQRRQALAQASGTFGRACEGWRARIVEARALVEAGIDFSDEADVAADALARGQGGAETLAREIETHLADARRGEIVRDGFRVVLAGPPNAGKSSLLNALAERDVAIVSPEPGTTRDVLEVRLDLAGYAVVLADTAGLREAPAPVEAEGIRRAIARAGEADLVLWIVDGAAPHWTPPAALGSRRVLVVRTKIDLVGASDVEQMPAGTIGVSSVTGEGLAALVAQLAAEVREHVPDGPDLALVTRPRHRAALMEAAAALRHAAGEGEAELAAEHLRLAGDALGRIIGRIDVEAVLDQIFSRFCIGK